MWRLRVASLLGLLLVGCSTSPKRAEPAPPAPTVAEADASVVPIATSTTLGTFVPPVVLVNPTMPPVDYPPGATEADLKAAEAAAMDFWIEVDRQFSLLPKENESAIVALTYPGKGAVRKITANLADVRAKGLRFPPATLSQQRINSVEVVAPFLINLEVCLADDGVVLDPTGKPLNKDLAASYVTMVMKRRAGTWLVADYGTSRPREVGKTCEN